MTYSVYTDRVVIYTSASRSDEEGASRRLPTVGSECYDENEVSNVWRQSLADNPTQCRSDSR